MTQKGFPASLRDLAATLRNGRQTFTHTVSNVNAAAKKTDPIDTTTWTSPGAGEATVRPSAPALARRRGHGYELAPPSPRDLIARAVVPVLPAELARPARNRSARRRLPRTAQRASGALIAALLGPVLGAALPAGQLAAASAAPTAATTASTSTTIAGDPATSVPGVVGADGSTTSTTSASPVTSTGATNAGSTPTSAAPAATVTTSPVTTPAADAPPTPTAAPGPTDSRPGVAAPPTSEPVPGTTTAVARTTTTAAPGSSTTAPSSSTSTSTTTTVDPESTTTTTVPVNAATTPLPVGDAVLPAPGTANDPVALAATQALADRHADEQTQVELLWTQTAREAADQTVARLTAEVSELTTRAFDLSAADQPTTEVEQQRTEAQARLDQARRDVATLTLRQAAAGAVGEQSASTYAATRRRLADAVATRAGVDGAKLDAKWAATSAARLDVVFVALAQVGDPYIWGATGPDTFDCSGLTGFAWKAAGVDLPHYTVSQRQTTLDVAEANLQPADLVFNLDGPNGGHVMMFLGLDHVVVAAPAPGLTVSISSWRSTTGFGSPLDDRIPAVVTDGTDPGTTADAIPAF